jgi:hypothetical protein
VQWSVVFLCIQQVSDWLRNWISWLRFHVVFSFFLGNSWDMDIN